LVSFIIKRLVQTIIVIFLVTIITFCLMQIIPGDPVVVMLGSEATQTEINALRHELWLDQPVPIQYFHWLNNVFHGDFGKSIIFHEEVTSLIAQRIPVTLYLSIWAFVGSIILGIFIGIISAIRRGSWIDNIVTLFANIGVAIPVFWLGILGIYFFGLYLGWLPVQGYTSPFVDLGKSMKQLVMPVICLGFPFLAVIARQTRSSMLEVIRQDYIRTAQSKGLKERVIVFRHALKNAFIPILTMIGMQIRVLIGGSVLVETVFNIPGMGRLLVQAAFEKDYLIVQGCIVIMSLITCFANLAVDISYSWVDPRVKYK
jgi:peptide/nickel transport system permease protein